LGLGAAGDDTLDPGLLEVVGRGLLTILAAKFCRGSGLGAVTGAGTGTGTGAGAALICWFISPLAALTRPAAPSIGGILLISGFWPFGWKLGIALGLWQGLMRLGGGMFIGVPCCILGWGIPWGIP